MSRVVVVGGAKVKEKVNPSSAVWVSQAWKERTAATEGVTRLLRAMGAHTSRILAVDEC
jgi:hypothetical protein